MPADPERLASIFGKECVGTFDAAPTIPLAFGHLPVVFPDSLPAAAEVVRFAAREGLRILPAGAGEHLGRATAGGPVDLALSTRRLSGIVEYEPEDMVMIVQAGATLHEVDSLAQAHAQRLGPDPWPGRAATVGGAVAGGRDGLSRSSRWRDVVLGARVVHADGSLSKTGGKVVKNVAGYDLSKLYVGSRGTLAVLGEINVKLVARPGESAFVVAVVERSRARDTLLLVHRSALAPAALLLVAGDVLPDTPLGPERVALCARFEGNAATVRWQVEAMLRTTPGEEWVGERGRVAYEALRRGLEPRAETVLARIASLPVEVPAALDCLLEGPAAAWREGASFIGQFGVGRSHAQLPGLGARDLRLLQARLAALGARLEVERAAERASLSPSPGTEPVLADLLTRTKNAFDPEGRFLPLGLGGGAP